MHLEELEQMVEALRSAVAEADAQVGHNEQLLDWAGGAAAVAFSELFTTNAALLSGRDQAAALLRDAEGLLEIARLRGL